MNNKCEHCGELIELGKECKSCEYILSLYDLDELARLKRVNQFKKEVGIGGKKDGDEASNI